MEISNDGDEEDVGLKTIEIKTNWIKNDLIEMVVIKNNRNQDYCDE